MVWILLIVLAAVAAYLAYSSYDSATKTFDWKKGVGALVIAAAAAWAYLSDSVHSLFQ